LEYLRQTTTRLSYSGRQVDKFELVLMDDGEVKEFNGLMFGTINGVVAVMDRVRKSVFRKRHEYFIEIAKRLRNMVDAFLMHETTSFSYQSITSCQRTRGFEQ